MNSNGPSFGLVIVILIIVWCVASSHREKQEREQAELTNRIYRVVIVTNAPAAEVKP